MPSTVSTHINCNSEWRKEEKIKESSCLRKLQKVIKTNLLAYPQINLEDSMYNLNSQCTNDTFDLQYNDDNQKGKKITKGRRMGDRRGGREGKKGRREGEREG